MLADMVSKGNRLVDVGCDHGFLSIYLVQQKTCPGALAMDVRKGPLAAAQTHVQEYGLQDYIVPRLSDGLKAFECGEAESLVCAGMGGPLMEKILRDSFEKAKSLKELILQPQSEIKEFRQFLRESGFVITDENAVIDEGKYYFAMKAVWQGQREKCESCEKSEREAGYRETTVPANVQGADMERDGTQQLYDMYGEMLLKGRHPVLHEYLVQRQEHLSRLRGQLAEADSSKANLRLPEILEELAGIADALAYFS